MATVMRERLKETRLDFNKEKRDNYKFCVNQWVFIHYSDGTPRCVTYRVNHYGNGECNIAGRHVSVNNQVWNRRSSRSPRIAIIIL